MNSFSNTVFVIVMQIKLVVVVPFLALNGQFRKHLLPWALVTTSTKFFVEPRYDTFSIIMSTTIVYLALIFLCIFHQTTDKEPRIVVIFSDFAVVTLCSKHIYSCRKSKLFSIY